MQFTILGSGGAMPTPRPFCQCKVCKKARKGIGRRNHSSAFLNKAQFLFDCGEDIKESINRENIKEVDAVFLTHWHPDHTFGLREIAEAHYDFTGKPSRKSFKVYLAKKVFNQLKENFPAVLYYKKKGFIKISFLEHGQTITKKEATITSIGYTGKESDIYGFLIETKKTRLLYTPCDTIKLNEKIVPKKLDVWVHEMGILSYKTEKEEIPFPELIKRVKRLKPKKVVLTHIEELETKRHGKKIKELERKYSDQRLKIAFDGMKIEI